MLSETRSQLAQLDPTDLEKTEGAVTAFEKAAGHPVARERHEIWGVGLVALAELIDAAAQARAERRFGSARRLGDLTTRMRRANALIARFETCR